MVLHIQINQAKMKSTLAIKRKSKSKSKKTLFNVGQCKQYNIQKYTIQCLIHMAILETQPNCGNNKYAVNDFQKSINT